MQEGSFYKFCISACIFMVLISLSINFVVALGIFPSSVPSPILNTSMVNATEQLVGSGDIFSFLGVNISTIFSAGLLAIAGLAIVVYYAVRTGSFNLIAVYLFGMIFFGSWLSNVSIFNHFGTFDSFPVLWGLYLMITVGMIFIFAGATIGILGGND